MQYAPLSDDSPNSSEGEKITNNGSNSIPMIKKITNIKPKALHNTNKSSSLSEPLRSNEDTNEDLLLCENGKDIEIGTPTTVIDDDDDDPFYVFKEDLTQKLNSMENNLQRYISIVQDTDTAVNNHQVKDEKKALKKSIKSVEGTIKDLQMTVVLVEKNRDQFLHIDSGELDQRKVFIQHASDAVHHAKREMSSDKIKSKMVQDERSLTLRRLGHNHNTSETDDFLMHNVTDARLMMQEQDDTLEELDEAVIRVGGIADQIHDEVTFQNKMLGDLEDDLVDAEEKLGLVMGKLGKLLKTKSRWQICTILLLILIVIVLIFLILYT